MLPNTAPETMQISSLRCMLNGRYPVLSLSCRRSGYVHDSKQRSSIRCKAYPPGSHIETQNEELLMSETLLKEYSNLKGQIMKNTFLSSGFFAFYFASTVSLKAGLSSILGSFGGLVYLTLLIRDVDQLSREDQIPIKNAQKIKNEALQRFFSFLAHYQQSLKPRLLPLVVLAICIRFSNLVIEDGFSLGEQGCMLVGFLSYKIPLLLILYESLKPRYEENRRSTTPKSLTSIEDDASVFVDLYGRRKPDVDEKLKNLQK